jgi:hypothetical protein
MANRIDSVGFSAAELLDQAAREHPKKRPSSTRKEELSFSILTGGCML